MILCPIEHSPFELVERDRSSCIYRRDGLRFDNAALARQEAMQRNGNRSWRPTPDRWWAVRGADGWTS